MADFCSQCTPFKNQFDIDLFNIALDLENEQSKGFLCEGCDNRGLYKDENGNLFLVKRIFTKISFHPVNIEDLMYLK